MATSKQQNEMAMIAHDKKRTPQPIDPRKQVKYRTADQMYDDGLVTPFNTPAMLDPGESAIPWPTKQPSGPSAAVQTQVGDAGAQLGQALGQKLASKFDTRIVRPTNRVRRYDDYVIDPANTPGSPGNSQSTPNLPATAPQQVSGPTSSALAGGPASLADGLPGDPNAHAQLANHPDPAIQQAYTTGMQHGVKAAVTTAEQRAAQLDTQQPTVTAQVQPTPLTTGFASLSPFASLLQGALTGLANRSGQTVSGGNAASPSGSPTGPGSATQVLNSILGGGTGSAPVQGPTDIPGGLNSAPPTVSQALNAPNPTPGQVQQPTQQPTQAPAPMQVSAMQDNPFPAGQSQTVQDAVHADAASMFNDPNVTAQNLSQQERTQLLLNYQKQLQDLQHPSVPLTSAQKFQQAHGIKQKLAALGAGIIGGIQIDPKAWGAAGAAAYGSGKDPAEAMRQQSQADTEAGQRQQQIDQTALMNKAQLVRDNLTAWQAMEDRDDKDNAANAKHWSDESTLADQFAAAPGGLDKGVFKGHDAVEAGIRAGMAAKAAGRETGPGEIDPATDRVFHTGDGQVRVVRDVNQPLTAEAAKAIVPANVYDPSVTYTTQSAYAARLKEKAAQAASDRKIQDAKVEAQNAANIKENKQQAKDRAAAGSDQAFADGVRYGTLTLDQIKDKDTADRVKALLMQSDKNLDLNSVQMTNADRTKQKLALSDQHNLNVIKDIITRRPDLVGALAGRETNGKWVVGSNDPDLASLKVAYDNYALAAVGIHGSRSVLNKEQAESALSNNNKNGQQAVLAGVQSAYDSADVFAHPTPKSKDGTPYIVLPPGNGQPTSPYVWQQALKKFPNNPQGAAQWLDSQGYK